MKNTLTLSLAAFAFSLVAVDAGTEVAHCVPDAEGDVTYEKTPTYSYYADITEACARHDGPETFAVDVRVLNADKWDNYYYSSIQMVWLLQGTDGQERRIELAHGYNDREWQLHTDVGTEPVCDSYEEGDDFNVEVVFEPGISAGTITATVATACLGGDISAEDAANLVGYELHFGVFQTLADEDNYFDQCDSCLAEDSDAAPEPTATPTASPSEPSPTRHVALGDSYSAGLGADAYEQGTHQGDGGNNCRRSANAYPVLVSRDQSLNLTFVACSSARTWHFKIAQYPTAIPPQAPQYEMASISSDVKLITFSIGGNDAGFAEILNNCVRFVFWFNNCSADPEKSEYPVRDAFSRLLGQPPPHGGGQADTIPLDTLFRELDDIRDQYAPRARVLVVGYPQFYRSRGTTFMLCVGIKTPDQLWVNEQLQELNGMLHRAATAHEFGFVGTSQYFEGHRLCEIGGGEEREWFHDTFNEGLYHPDADGQAAMARAVLDYLAGDPVAANRSAAGSTQETALPTPVLDYDFDGATVRLNAARSTGSGGIGTVQWFINTACGTIAELSGTVAEFSFPYQGQYGVTLRVTDGHGRAAYRGIPTGLTVTAGPPLRVGDLCYAERIDGEDVVGTAVAISQRRYPSVALGEAAAHPAYALLARDDQFADALAGSSLSGLGPLLFAHSHTLPAATRAELERVVPGGRVVVLGGPNAIDEGVVATLNAAGFTTQRISGPSRIETALSIADELVARGPAPSVALTRGFGSEDNPTASWADAVTAGGWVARVARNANSPKERVPLLLTPTHALHPAVATWLREHGTTHTTILGGSAAVSDTVATSVPGPSRIAGPDRASTAVAIAQRLWDTYEGFTLVNGYEERGWAYGLAAAGLAAESGAPVLLSERSTLPLPTDRFLRDCSARYGAIIGPPDFLSLGIESDAGGIVASCRGG